MGFVALQSIPKKLLSQSHMSLYAWEYNASLFAYKKPPNHRHWTLSGKQKRETGSWSICEWLINFSTTTRDVLSPWLQACSNAPSATQTHRDLILLCAWVSSGSNNIPHSTSGKGKARLPVGNPSARLGARGSSETPRAIMMGVEELNTHNLMSQ